ncbi:MAG: glycosyl hydrolase [Alphaproteobacteria bacterium]
MGVDLGARIGRTMIIGVGVLTILAGTMGGTPRAALALEAAAVQPEAAEGSEEASKAPENPFAGLAFRNIGPAFPSGRISDFAVVPGKPHVYFAATSSGNLWKTDNNGTTWTALFENEGSYAIGAISIDPTNPHVVWVGTGENNAQRSVANGDGVYKSMDGGKTWTNMGLAESGHISQIWIDPVFPDRVLVAAQGPLWNGGGERGLYQTLDGGETWTRLLEIDAYTGVNEFVVHPTNPDVIIASTYQRHRHVWTMINGGPGSGIHKSTDGGQTWREITAGLPRDHMGRIGLGHWANSLDGNDFYDTERGRARDPNLIYAIIEANDEEKGIYASTDFGETWTKRSSRMTTAPFYYNELVVDPVNPERLYSLDTFTHVSEDGGRTWSRLSSDHRHVDDHALWIDKANTEHLLIGGDGGIYESFDRGQTWRHINNLPIVQFYRIQPDNAEPFYNVCGGTQDNNSLCGPSRTTVVHGITNSDWKIILGGDGYKPQIDPTDPNIVYTQYQYGGLARYDRRTQERVYITPQPDSGIEDFKWNWNTPLLISPHDPNRLYYGAEFLFRSDDRGDSWTRISPDLTRQLDRNALEVMGRVWSVDSIGKNDSTSIYGSLIAVNESPLREGLIYAGSDDGVISVTEDGGATWRSVRRFEGVPDMALVEDIIASVHDENVAYAVFDNHKKGDFRPYVLKTADKGRTWRAISGTLPERGSAHTIAEDHVDPDLLFVGTEFGLFFTQDGGRTWLPMKGGFPTIAVRDLEIQRRENDLVVGTFGRSIYILDDYTPLRVKADALADAEGTLFPVRDAKLYIEGDLWGNRKKGSLGAQYYTADNPPYGAVFTYHLRDGLKTLSATRRAQEIEVEAEGGDTPYPSWDDLRAEDRENAPAIVFTIRDGAGAVVRRITGPVAKGLHRVAWDLRLPAPDPVRLDSGGPRNPWDDDPEGPLALPGTYTVAMAKRVQGTTTPLGAPQTFTVKALARSPEATQDRPALLAFQQRTADLARAVEGAAKHLGALGSRIEHLKVAVNRTPQAQEATRSRLQALEARHDDLRDTMLGDRTIASRNEPVPMSIRSRVRSIISGHWGSQAPVTGLHRRAYDVAAQEFEGALKSLEALETDLETLEAELEGLGAPWTPGRMPVWSRGDGE